jgi:hypothetical protein
VPGIEGKPAAAEIRLEPRVEIHRRGIGRNADVAEIAVAIARRDVETAAERYREMGEVAADADAFRQGLAGSPGRARSGLAEREPFMDEIADRVHLGPTAGNGAEVRPGEIG